MISLSENNNNGNKASQNEVDSNTEYEDINVEMASQKAERLECTVAVLEAEVSHLSSTILDLEQSTIRLEQENGRLLAESLMVYRKFNLSRSKMLCIIMIKKQKSSEMQYTFTYLQNATLQAQVSQLQEDIAKDTELRQELFDKLKHAKAGLTQELSKLDRCLKVRYRLTLSLS